MSFLAVNLELTRERFGYSQAQLAEICHVDELTYSFYEEGKSEPSVSCLSMLCRMFQVSLDEMVNYDLSEKNSEYFAIEDAESAQRQELQTLFYFHLLSSKERNEVINIMKETVFPPDQE